MHYGVLSSKFAGTLMCFLLLTGMTSAAQSISPAGEQDAISIPRLINYQGYLTDGAGDPLSGSYGMGFRILDAATGGTSWWSETQASVSVSEGVFNVILGSVATIESLPDGPGCWLEITVGGELIAPRVRLVSVPYSYGADKAADAEALGGIAAANNVHNATAAGGDLAGTYPSPTIAQKGAAGGQVLKWNGSAWMPQNDQAGTSLWTDSGSYVYANNNSNARVYDYNAGAGCYFYANNTTNSSARPYGVYAIGSNGNGMFDYGGYGVYGYGHGYYGQCYGLFGYADVYTANVSYPSHGVYGFSPSQYGRGVTGAVSGASSFGVYGQAGTNSTGVYGYNGATGTCGALGSFSPAAGVYGYSNVTGFYPVYGYSGSSATAGYGVYGCASGYGVYGRNYTYYVQGALASSYGPSAVYGDGGNHYGGYFYNVSTSRPAVYGENAYYDVRGELGSYNGGLGNQCGVYGYGGIQYYGVYGYGGTVACGVYGAGGWAGGCFYDTDASSYAVIASGSSKIYGSGSVGTFIIDGDNYERALVCPEAPEVVFEDYGSNRLANGYRRVNLDPLLLRGVTINDEFPLRVYVTVKGTEPVPVSVQSGDSYFEVFGPEGSNVAFDWRIVANRKDFTNFRFPKHQRPDQFKNIGDHPGFNEVEPDQRRSEYTQ